MSSTFSLDSPSFFSALAEHLSSELGVSLKVEGADSSEPVKANGLILSVSSEYLRKAIDEAGSGPNPCITLKYGLDLDQVSNVVEFLHKGSVTLNDKAETEKFLETCNELQIKFLLDSDRAKFAADDNGGDGDSEEPPAKKVAFEAKEKDDEDEVDDDCVEVVPDSDEEDTDIEDETSADASAVDGKLEKELEKAGPERAKSVNKLLKEISMSMPPLEAKQTLTRFLSKTKILSGEKLEEGNKAVEKVPSLAKVDSKGLTETDHLIFRYHEWKEKQYNIRLRATKKMGLSGEYWQCDRCPYWNYSKANVRKHQQKTRH